MKKIIIILIFCLINIQVFSNWILTKEEFIKNILQYNSNNTYFCLDWTQNCLDEWWVSLEKALEVLFVNSWIYSIQNNNQIINLISLWEIKEDLAKDVSPKNIDWSVNYYYGFIKKALETNYFEVDIYWNKKDYFLLKKDSNGNLNTKKYLTQEEFLYVLYIFNKLKPSINLEVLENESSNINLENIDTDWDWVFDNDDKCATFFWDKNNFWCPILDEKCLANSEKNTCKSWYICNQAGFCEIEKIIKNDCIYPENNSSIFWNTICSSCPCDYKLNFLSTIRKCDILLPAIVSPDGSEIYSKWSFFQIPYE